MIKKLLKEFAGKLDSVIGNKLDEMMETNQEARADSNGKMVQALAKLFVNNGFISTFVNDGENVQTLLDYADSPAADKLASVFNRLEPQEQDDVADELVDAMIDIHGDPYDFLDDPGKLSMYDSEEIKQAMSNKTDESTFENEDFDEEDDEEEDESAEAKKDSVFVQLKKITDSFENFEDPNPKKPIIKNPLRHVVTDDGITVEVSYDDAVAIVDLMQADVKPESKQKMQELMQTAEGLESLIDYLSS